uniref:BRCT domain-containing protein n=1 Tax=Hucho hucho TaxID=62062 RepID=A0A4W5QIP3_9TELE
MGGILLWVSKTFNKHVTHVVFKNGHQATWNKAKKTGVRLVSVLWVARCKDDGEHVDEELCPALNDEDNSALKKRVHRCMQPRDTPERTPENDRRIKKKLDKMIEDLVPKSPFIADVSPYIIDEEKGIVYSPSMKRCDFMAQRLKEMREARENLSPTGMFCDWPMTIRTLVMTSMPTEKQHIVTQVVQTLGGFPVVDQILWCLEQRQFQKNHVNFQITAPVCRDCQQDLFLGQPAMFVSRDAQPPTHSLVELIELCGGTVCKTVRLAGLCMGKYEGKRPDGSRILSEQWVLGKMSAQC